MKHVTLARIGNVLNGWRRLWIFVGVLYAVPLAWWAFTQANDIAFSQWQSQTHALERSADARLGLKPQFHMIVNRDGTVRLEPLPVPLDRVRLREADAQYQAERREADAQHRRAWRSHQLSFGGIALILWVVPMTAVYALGSVVAWVVRGFRKPTTMKVGEP